ncbi:MAG: heparinase, partial [Desulfamplus sp.]|nr:heparinase [Desulfamplus sp.]
MEFNELTARVKRMSLQEIFYRLGRYLTARTVKRRKGLYSGKIPKIRIDSFQQLKMPTFIINHVSDLLMLSWDAPCFYLNGNHKQIIFEVAQQRNCYHADITHGCFKLDIRQIWESGRLQYLTIKLILPQNEESPKKNKNDILKWIKDNPFLFGPYYMSPMELGLRIPVFFYALRSKDIDWAKKEADAVLATIYKHTWWISNNLALYSSLGNHTICESIGLIFGGAVFQKTEEGERWLKRGYELLETELFHQLLDDGGPAEQSLNYHRFVLDLYWLAIDFLETNKLYECTKWRNRLNAGEKF